MGIKEVYEKWKDRREGIGCPENVYEMWQAIKQEVERKKVERENLKLTLSHLSVSDCGSSSCMFGGRGKGGQRINGRCTCIDKMLN